jgi:hypothetical protein
MDFTIESYSKLLKMLQNSGYNFQTFADFIREPEPKAVVLRHDVDKLPQNSLCFAKIQAGMGIKGSYYFRAVADSWDEDIIKEIADLGHEVGYHYETMDTAYDKRGAGYDDLLDLAYVDFCKNLAKLRKLVPVCTICMHGSPRAKFDNKDIWKKYDYKSLGLIGEPYYDVDFDNVFYLTDTGRRWDGWETSVRDKVPQQEKWIHQGLVYHNTNNIIEAIQKGDLPNQVMFTFHPQRWHNKVLPWLKEFVLQKIKNQVKRILINK